MSDKKKTALVISYSPLHCDPRVLRQIYALKDDYIVQTVGFTNPNVDHAVFFEIALSSCRTFFEKVCRAFSILCHSYKSVLAQRLSLEKLFLYNFKVPDVIFANDYDGLYAAELLKRNKGWNCAVYFDSHEYFPRYRESLFWKIFEGPLVRYVFLQAKCSFSIMSTVSPVLARMYERYFGFKQNSVLVITNSPDYEKTLKPAPLKDKIRIIHHGRSIKIRHLEKMIDVMKYLPPDGYELFFMLVHDNDEAYYRKLVKRASKYKNIHFCDPVPTDEISSFINQFDIGLFVLDNKIINYRYALPNKFFEFVQSRLAIVVGDSPEMRACIQNYGLGVAAKKNTSRAVAEVIVKMSKDDIMGYKNNAHGCAKSLSSEKNIEDLKRIACDLSMRKGDGCMWT